MLWIFVLKSGVHATLAGVITALAIPRDVNDEDGHAWPTSWSTCSTRGWRS